MAILLGPKSKTSVTKTIPIVALKDSVVFPHTESSLVFGRVQSVAAVKAAFSGPKTMAVFLQKDSQKEDLTKDDLYQIGTLCEVDHLLEMEGFLYVYTRGLSRVYLENLTSTDPFLAGQVIEIPEVLEESDELKALAKHLLTEFGRAVNLGKQMEGRVLMKLASGVNTTELTDQVAQVLEIKTSEKQALLEIVNVKKRIEEVIQHLAHEIKILELERSIARKTQDKFDKGMQEAVLRERKKTIEKELKRLRSKGGKEDEEGEIREFRKKIKEAKMPQEAEKKANEQLNRLKKMHIYNPEAGYIRAYLEWLVAMPWSKRTANNVSITRAEKILNEDHYGLKKVKERILEYLAVMKLKNTGYGTRDTGHEIEEKDKTKIGTKGESKEVKQELKEGIKEEVKKKEEVSGPTILCFIGPPGTGKTSIGKSVARALGRKFVRISLGGIRDEAEIRGHRRTYVGALPGRIIQGIKNAGTKNPVFMLDEIDKVGADFRGDPSAALLEALDPEQNREFSDHYLEVPFDLSEVFFITTGNVLGTIPPALQDRLEVIRFPGYTEEEKYYIAKFYLWPKQIKAHGLKEKSLRLSETGFLEVIRRYTREAGVRELERSLATLCRKVARKVAEKKEAPKLLGKSDIRKFLGPPKFTSILAERKDEVGLATGLAWTQAGGEILFIEIALMPGKGTLMLTGHLGDVMKESCQAAMTYVRAHWQELGLKKDFAKKLDIHIHVPEGAIPKDGPSAGIAIATAIISALTKTPVRREVGMTGEITLRGRVLEIGGVKEKVIAGHRAGLKTIILPKDNKKDLEDISRKIKRDLKFIFVENLDEVLAHAFKKRLKVKEEEKEEKKTKKLAQKRRIKTPRKEIPTEPVPSPPPVPLYLPEE